MSSENVAVVVSISSTSESLQGGFALQANTTLCRRPPLQLTRVLLLHTTPIPNKQCVDPAMEVSKISNDLLRFMQKKFAPNQSTLFICFTAGEEI